MELAVGTVVDRYVVDQILGEGGMAVVYLCKHTQLGTLHALKVLTISSRAIRERLVQEGQVQASLRHANIVAVTDIVMINGAPGLVMEYIDGPSVDELLEERSLSYEQVDVLVQGILAGVAHAHDQGLVHRDLKPANIMLGIRGSALIPKVTDFGLAKLLDADNKRAATRTGSTMGTPHYMSPEQVSDSKNVDSRTDVFALGAVLYEMVSGQRAFSGDNLLQLFSAAANGAYTPIRELKPDIPDRFEAAIHGSLEPDREKRIQSVHDLLAIWKGEKLRSVGAAPDPVETGPFDADFLKSVKSITSMSSGAPSTPDPTWSPGGEEAVKVESLFKSEQDPVVVIPPRGDAVSSSSLVSGKSLVVGGGAAFLLAGGAGVVALLAVGAFGLWWANQPREKRQITRVEDRVQPVDPVPGDVVVPTPAEPEPATEPSPVPGPRPEKPSGQAPDPKPPVEPTAPELEVPEATDVPAATDAPEPAATDAPAETDAPTEPEPEMVQAAGLTSEDPKVRQEAVVALRANPKSTSTLIALTTSDGSEKVRREAHEALAWQAVKGRGDKALLKPYFTMAVQKNLFKMGGKNMRAYGFVGDDLPMVEAFILDNAATFFNVRKGIEALGRIAIRTNRKAEGLAALDRVEPKIESKMAKGVVESVRERLQN